MPLLVPNCFRLLQRRRSQREKEGQQQPQRQSHADSIATALMPRETLVDCEDNEQQQHTRTEPQQQQQPRSSLSLRRMASAAAPPANTTAQSDVGGLPTAMLARAVSHSGHGGDPPEGPQGAPSEASNGGQAIQQQLSQSRLPIPQFHLYVWGLNDCGQLMSPVSESGGPRRGAPPASVAKLEGKSVCGCCLGLDRTWVWDVGQSVWGGGSNEGGCIDPEGEAVIPKPKLSEGIRNAVCVAAGEDHTIAIMENGSAVAFGSNEFGQLARGPAATSLRSFDPKAMQVDHSKPFLQGQIRLRQAACGEGYSLVLSETGMLLACGQSPHGCLGLGEAQEQQVEPLLRPVPAVFALPIKQVSASSGHVLALSISGEVFSWGNNKWGRLGLGDAFDAVKQVASPTLVRLALRVRMVAASETHSGLIVSGGLLYLCGSNCYGELSYPVGTLPASRDRLPRGADANTPVAWSSRFLLVAALHQYKVKLVALGRHFSMALTKTGRVFTWGVNDLNQLGLSSDVHLPLSLSLGEGAPPPRPHAVEPQPLWLPSGGPPPSQLLFYLISAGAFTACAAAVQLPPGGAEGAAANEVFDGFFRQVLCRSRSSVGWEQRKLTAATAAAAAAGPGAGCCNSPLSGFSFLSSAAAPSSACKQQENPAGLQRLLTLSRGDSSGACYDVPVAAGAPPGGPAAAAAAGAAAADGLARQDSSTQDVASFFLAGVSVEEVLRLLEGARSTGSLMHLRLMITQVFGDVFRLNSSFAHPGHGSVPDFEGLNAVYGQLPRELLPLVFQSFSSVVGATVKSAQHLKRPDQIKFILFILACTPLFSGFSEERNKENGQKVPDGAAAAAAAAEGADAAEQQQQQQQQQQDSRGELLYAALIHLLFHLPPEGKRSFLRLAKEFPDTIFEKALVRTACRFLARAVREAGSRYRIVDRVWHCAALLQLLYQANTSSNRQVLITKAGYTKIPLEKFQIEELGTLVDPLKEVGAYVEIAPRQTTAERQIKRTLCFFAFAGLRLFDVGRDVINSSELQSSWCLFMAHLNLCPLSFKRNVLLVDNIFRQHHVSLESLLNTQLPFLILRVRRSDLVEDACKALGSCDPRDLLRPLKVIFDGEEGVDEGGLRREFFSLLTRELFSPSRGLFSYNSGVRTLWFTSSQRENSSIQSDSHAEEAGVFEVALKKEGDQQQEEANGNDKNKEQPPNKQAKEYWLTGLLASMAVYNDILMPLNLPLVVYKRLQGSAVSLEDLSDVFPDELNSFAKLLEIDDENTFNAAFEGMTFAVDVEIPGNKRMQIPLKPGGEDIPLTMKTRAEFVELYTHYLLVDSVEEQFRWFEKGFKLAASPLLSSLTGRELQLLLCGTPELNFEELRDSCRYEGYEADSPYIKSLWEILISFDIYQKQNFLKFVSGSDRSPAFGLKELHLVVQKNGAEPTDRLPTAYTCFCTLLLPEYGTKEKLERLLTIAIEQSEGFGLQ
ncbi:hypothetical protein Efla_002794 [Eimeria flavescens]